MLNISHDVLMKKYHIKIIDDDFFRMHHCEEITVEILNKVICKYCENENDYGMGIYLIDCFF